MLVSKHDSLGYRAEALLLQSEGSARSSPSILLDPRCQQGSIRGKMVPLAPFQELELDTEPILSYYIRRKSAVNPDQVQVSATFQGFSFIKLFEVWQPSSDCEQTAISTVIIIVYCPHTSGAAWCTAEGKE